jgi:hypothetical protein
LNEPEIGGSVPAKEDGEIVKRKERAPIKLSGFERDTRPTIDQEMHEPSGKKPELVRAVSPSGEK